MIFNMTDQPGPPGATPKNEGQGFVVDKNIELLDPERTAKADPTTGLLTEPERLAKADPVFWVVEEKKVAGHHPSAAEVYGKKPVKSPIKEKDFEGTPLDEIMQKVTEPDILIKAEEMYKARDGAVIKTVEDVLKELAKGGRVGEAKIPNIPVKPARSRLTRAGWRTTQNKSQLTPRTVRDVFPAIGKK